MKELNFNLKFFRTNERRKLEISYGLVSMAIVCDAQELADEAFWLHKKVFAICGAKENNDTAWLDDIASKLTNSEINYIAGLLKIQE